MYVTVNGGGFANRAKLAERIAQSNAWLDEIQQELGRDAVNDRQAPRHRQQLEREIAAARQALTAIR